MSIENKAYIQLTNLLNVSQNNSKDAHKIIVNIFDIKIDTSCFTVYFL